ncbi:MAG: gliding motility-associated C-terminal domain-containing protein, partial [bacterium]|nr:gliding motility-associated C-terminal domain-containing protein [bacterium]
YCKNDLPNPTPSFTTGTAGSFSATPAGLVFVDTATGEINLSLSNAGVYTVSNTFAASGGCDDVIEVFTITITAPAVGTFNYGTGIYCSDGGTATPTFTGGGTAGIFTVSPLGLTIDANGVITLAGAEGTYTVTNTIAAAGGCTGVTETATITITAPLSGSISYAGPFCKSVEGSQSVSNTAVAGGVYSATPSGLTIDAATGTITPNSSTAGIYTVSYDLPAPVGCDAFTTSTSVTIFPDFFITSEVGCEGNNYVLHALPASASFDPLTSTFSWSPSTFSATDSPDAVIANSPGTYTVTVTSADGCTASLDIPAFDISCAIQKGISPNNDGKNDFFDLTVLNVKHLTIFNRYGTEVYQLGNYKNEWSGQSNSGEELPDATYFYVIEKMDGKQDTGWIYINR